MRHFPSPIDIFREPLVMTPAPIPASRSRSVPLGPLAALALSLACLSGPVAAEGWSFTKVITVNHFGDREDNDGFRPESFYFEKEFGESSRWMVGFIENSEGRTGPSIGYSYDFQRGEDWTSMARSWSHQLQERQQYQAHPAPGHALSPDRVDRSDAGWDVRAQVDEHYLLVITGVNYDFPF